MALSKPQSGMLEDERIRRIIRVKELVNYTKGNLNDLNVLPYKEPSMRGMKLFRVKRVVSPFEFYVEYAMDSRWLSDSGYDGNYRYDEWFERMQSYYNDPEKWCDVELYHGFPLKGHCYVCATYAGRGNVVWQRVRVHEANYDIGKALVFFCDLGKSEVVTFERLRRIKPEFCKWSAQVFRCYLYDLCPINKEKPGELSWTPQACASFKQLLLGRFGKEFYAAIMTRSDSIVRKGMPEIYINLGIVLFERISGTKTLPEFSVNELMVQRGYAVSQGFLRSPTPSTLHVRILKEVKKTNKYEDE